MPKRTRNDTSRKPWTRSDTKPRLDKMDTDVWLVIAKRIGHKKDANRSFFGLLARTCKGFYLLTKIWSLSWEPKHRLAKAVYAGDTPLLKQLVGEDTSIESVISAEDARRYTTAAIRRNYFGVVSWLVGKNLAYSFCDMELVAKLGNVPMFELGWKRLYNYATMFVAEAAERAHDEEKWDMLQYILNKAVDASLPEHVQCNVFCATKWLVHISVGNAIEDGDRSLFEKVRFPWRYTERMLQMCHHYVVISSITQNTPMKGYFIDFLRLMHDKGHKLPDTMTEQLNSSCPDFEQLRASLHAFVNPTDDGVQPPKRQKTA